ncbi:MAG TPA: hypothetical protein VKY24_20205 [Reyranella sp.]|nr:hypothetical protein [Reyranella sp.]
MRGRFITVDERAVLQELETRGPTRQLSARMSGRLSLYGMIDEGPHGWVITAEGRKMLKNGRVAPRTPQELILSMRPVLATAENMAWVDDPAELAAA